MRGCLRDYDDKGALEVGECGSVCMDASVLIFGRL